MLEAVGHASVVNPAYEREASVRGLARVVVLPVALRDRSRHRSAAAIATTAAVGISALAAGAVTYATTPPRFASMTMWPHSGPEGGTGPIASRRIAPERAGSKRSAHAIQSRLQSRIGPCC